MMVNSFWNAAQGNMFYSPYVGMSYPFGNHFCPLVLLLFPVYWLVSSAYTLLFCQSLLIGASGLPFYLLARRVHGDTRVAGLLTAAYLFYPTVVTNHVDQIHFEPLALPFLVGAAYFFFAERFWYFTGFAVLGMMGQENLPLTVGMFGVYAAVMRRNLKWIGTPLLLALVYGLLVFKVALPYFTQGAGYVPAHYFGPLGDTPGDVIKTMVTKPFKVLEQVFQFDRGIYIVQVLQPLLWVVPLLAWELILVAPSLGINLVVNEAAFRTIPWHYGATVGAFLCVAMLFGMKRLATLLERRWKIASAQFALALAVGAVSISSWIMWLNIGEYIPHGYFPTLRRAAEQIPPEKSVVAPSTMLAHFAGREHPFHLMQFDPRLSMSATWPREKLYTMDYVILDGNERRFPMELVTRDLVMSFHTNLNYELIFNDKNVFVYRKRDPLALAPGGLNR
ncbi:MAG: hypothetical protein PCFJNLEI_02916 [Verrucomicrobiae bacterium]|nr:hypothetical protein [Verrucomicrobiae bacterium]